MLNSPLLVRKNPIVFSIALSRVATNSIELFPTLGSLGKVARKSSTMPNVRSSSSLSKALVVFSLTLDDVSKAFIQPSQQGILSSLASYSRYLRLEPPQQQPKQD